MIIKTYQKLKYPPYGETSYIKLRRLIDKDVFVNN